MATIIKCDRCGQIVEDYSYKKIAETKHFNNVFGSGMFETNTYLCKECYEEFQDWLKPKERKEG